MKAILISIRPEWCRKIFQGEKTVEVRKTVPNFEPPFKCYVYCTLVKSLTLGEYVEVHRKTSGEIDDWSGKVIGSFICDEIEDYSKWNFDYPSLLRHINMSAATNDNYTFLNSYLKGEKRGYGLHIVLPELFNKPKELYKFHGICKKNKQKPAQSCKGCKYAFVGIADKSDMYCDTIIETPPQSWMYCEDEYDD